MQGTYNQYQNLPHSSGRQHESFDILDKLTSLFLMIKDLESDGTNLTIGDPFNRFMLLDFLKL